VIFLTKEFTDVSKPLSPVIRIDLTRPDGSTVRPLSDNGTMVGVKEPNRASLTPLAVPMSLGAGHGSACNG